ncbi:MAG TPA: gephyrin-like molybdotransferase Glp [Pirellulales bacterium]|nr:gephyrin-like molybdotransferase Glp [Pirellulales bacterium]
MAQPLIEIDDARKRILQCAQRLGEKEAVCLDALGCVLAEDIVSDVDSPPHDKSIVDGYAVISADLPGGEGELEILEEIVAGSVPSRALTAGHASRIMTGAPIPAGTDAVVMLERCQLLAGGEVLGRVRIRDPRLVGGQNVVRRAAAMRTGELVLRRGQTLRPLELGLLAEVGRQRVRIVARPRVAVLSTGDELVPVDCVPGPAQLRNSNEPMLVACVVRSGGLPQPLGIARDEREQLRALIGRGLESADVLVLSGGVSAGVLDLVPGVLRELGVEQVFHKVNVKPGKPVWFGVGGGSPARLVFGLPGNPVSSLVCFRLFVAPALASMSGRSPADLELQPARLLAGFSQHGDRPSFQAAALARQPDGLTARPLKTQGSGDLRGLSAANGLAYFPSGERRYEAGEMIEACWLD